MAKVYFLIGSNLGNREEMLQNAVQNLNRNVGEVVALSTIYETQPWGFNHENHFLNQAVEVHTCMLPENILHETQQIEKKLGRIRKKNSYSERSIDIDILLYDDLIFSNENLEIPHPRMKERMFVLTPLCELAPNLIHPVLGTSIRAMKNACEDKSEVRIDNKLNANK